MPRKKSKTIPVEDKGPVSELEMRVDEMMSVEKRTRVPAEKTEAAKPPKAAASTELSTAPELGKMAIPGVEDVATDKPEVSSDAPVVAADKPGPETATETEAAPEPESKPRHIDEDPDEDPTLAPVIDEIVAKESDELLAHADAAAGKPAVVVGKPTAGERFKGFFKAWWKNKLARYGTILVVLAALCAVGAYPPTRYYALNLAGVRSGASLTILDNETQLPLKNVSVEIGDHKSRTNEDGLVKLSSLELGTQSLTISQTGFSTINETVTLGLGSNPLGEYKLDSIGMQFRVSLVDYLSGKPVRDAEMSSEESNAQANDKGQIILTIEPDETSSRDAQITADGYRSETLKLEPGQGQNRTIQLVPDRKHVYISRQSGKYDLYKSDIDGKNKELLLAATGNEDGSISVVQSRDGKQVALVSKRDTLKNQDGYVLQSLTLIDVEKGRTLSLEKSERIQVVDWIGDRIVYVKIKAGSSAGSPDRYQLISYDHTTNSRQQLANANYFVDVVSAGGQVYYVTSNNYQGGVSQFVRTKPDGSGKQVLLDKTDVWNVLRDTYDTMTLVGNQVAYSYKLGDNSAKQNTSPGSNTVDRYYLDDGENKLALWADNRDGKGVLLLNNLGNDKDAVLTTQSGLGEPIRWLNDMVAIYRINKPGETADYAISLDGGDPKKITDVTATSGYGRWYY